MKKFNFIHLLGEILSKLKKLKACFAAFLTVLETFWLNNKKTLILLFWCFSFSSLDKSDSPRSDWPRSDRNFCPRSSHGLDRDRGPIGPRSTVKSATGSGIRRPRSKLDHGPLFPGSGHRLDRCQLAILYYFYPTLWKWLLIKI